MNISLDQFIQLLEGVKVQVTADNVTTPQCVDVAQLWAKALGAPRFTGDAEDIYNQAGDTFEQIANTPTNMVEKGDIVVLGSKYNGTVGHVVIATGEGNIMEFKAFGQNSPMGTDCEARTYSYDAPDGTPWVLGWLRKK